MTAFRLMIIIGLMFLLTSCSAKESQTNIHPVEAEQTETVPSREAIYVYSKQADLNRVVLKLSGEPILLASGYIQLAGVVWGEEPVALVEVGGRGIVVKEGERIDAYRVSRISGDSVILEKKP